MVNLTAAERVYEYWIDKASSAADLVLKIVFAVILFLVARKLILWLCGLIRKNMRRFHTEEAVVSFTVSMVKYSLNTLLVLTIIVQLGYRIRGVDRQQPSPPPALPYPWPCRAASQTLQAG